MAQYDQGARGVLGKAKHKITDDALAVLQSLQPQHNQVIVCSPPNGRFRSGRVRLHVDFSFTSRFVLHADAELLLQPVCFPRADCPGGGRQHTEVSDFGLAPVPQAAQQAGTQRAVQYPTYNRNQRAQMLDFRVCGLIEDYVPSTGTSDDTKTAAPVIPSSRGVWSRGGTAT